jgi:competence protein ComEA
VGQPAGVDLIGEERGRLARVASWFDASPTEIVGLAVLLVCALVATGVLVWSALGRPDLAATGADPGADPGAAAVGHEPGPGEEHDHGGRADLEVVPEDAPHGSSEVAASAEVTIHVAGAVGAPGVVTLPAGARVTDAIEAAGGLLEDADPARINLARPLEDGEQLLVLRVGEEPPAAASRPASAGEGAGAASDGAGDPDGGPIDLNTATAEQLETLPGVGPAIAGRIVQHREAHGPFRTPGDLRDVSGIGEKRFQDLADLVTVG